MNDIERRNLRKKVLEARDLLSIAQRREKSRAAMKNFFNLPEVDHWAAFFIYVNFRSELQTMELIRKCLEQDRRVAVPLVEAATHAMIPLLIKDPGKDLKPGYYGIPEPDPRKCAGIDAGEIDVAIIPGSVFDVHGGRLGYGGGYYDRFLVNEAPQARRIGFAYELQLVEKVPLQPHDQPLDILITESRVVTIDHKREETGDA